MRGRQAFRDPFGAVAADYASFRPTYPAALFDLLAGVAPGRRSAWDCATGSGQAACGLARHFQRVVASDASPAQLASASPRAGVFYVRARAEAAPLPPASMDLVTVAQALHWLDIPAFWREARRVLVRDGLVAVWCYSLCRIGPEIDTVVDHFYKHTVGPFWAPERGLTDTGYRTVPFPFTELDVTAPDMRVQLTLPAFLGYIGTWSATEGYRARATRGSRRSPSRGPCTVVGRGRPAPAGSFSPAPARRACIESGSEPERVAANGGRWL